MIGRAFLRPLPAGIGLFVLLSLLETAAHFQNRRFVRETALRVVSEAGARTSREKALALRDFLRGHVTLDGVDAGRRPILRDSSEDTLRTGRGYCGEVSRAFICLAREVGIPAQRINLYGEKQHVVAEANLGDGENVIVDGQSPPTVEDLESLDRVIQRPEFDDYSTVNLRRLGLSRVISRIKFEIGPWTYFLEYPHCMKAFFWAFLAVSLAAAAGARKAVLWVMHRRGCVHSPQRIGILRPLNKA